MVVAVHIAGKSACILKLVARRLLCGGWPPAVVRLSWQPIGSKARTVVNVLTHGITLSTAVAVGCLCPWVKQSSQVRYRCGLWSGLIVAIAYAVVADQILFGCLLAGAITVGKPLAAAR